jgi:hypothetical protein
MQRLPLVALLVVAGCNGTTTPAGQPGDAGPTGPASYSLTFGPITVPSGTERTQCIVRRLGNPDPLQVGSIHNVLGNASHHMIVYRVADTVEQPVPFDCMPFTDTLDPSKGAPVMITQKKDDTLTLPSGVGYTMQPNQMLRIELHYLNSTPGDVMLSASTTMTATADYHDEADFLLIGDTDIKIPAGMQTTLGPVFYQIDPKYADAKFFALTGHEHRLGTDVQIAVATGATDTGTAVYDVPNWQWSEPNTIVHDPPFTIPTGGGFRFTCQWNNTTTTQVNFGESATDEMCFFWAYYYPSKGTNVCLHSAKNGDHCLK